MPQNSPLQGLKNSIINQIHLFYGSIFSGIDVHRTSGFEFDYGIFTNLAEDHFVAKEEFLNAALKTMKEEYGSINQFMIKGLNISMQQKEDFKQKVLE